ncbi:Crp/Fnr family transcriptional regulator [Niabella ginsengisoli]|uniref:Crp/Fnr family transcriptional regulator n=1 Tax=Niabella ginsengisoli TaxID=522298 RepID=A0ABS9SNJ9_9BACT|nr:Crp/Fnr family transcriptional regulator [Niabella ginsengisoli]MCH5599930.1 Crp/Fnr family transcriptional regulator [Niabella ginsengisoli]
MSIDQILKNIYPLPDTSQILLENCFNEVAYTKGQILLRPQKIETSVYFIKKGMVRAYEQSVDQEITFWFGKEGDPVISMKSYIQNERGYEYVSLLENTAFYKIDAKSLQDLYLQDLHISNWGRKLAEQELLKTEERLISRQVRSASDRYKDLMRDQPDLIRRVPLGFIASYLGITQVSLSRIRAEIK